MTTPKQNHTQACIHIRSLRDYAWSPTGSDRDFRFRVKLISDLSHPCETLPLPRLEWRERKMIVGLGQFCSERVRETERSAQLWNKKTPRSMAWLSCYPFSGLRSTIRDFRGLFKHIVPSPGYFKSNSPIVTDHPSPHLFYTESGVRSPLRVEFFLFYFYFLRKFEAPKVTQMWDVRFKIQSAHLGLGQMMIDHVHAVADWALLLSSPNSGIDISLKEGFLSACFLSRLNSTYLKRESLSHSVPVVLSSLQGLTCIRICYIIRPDPMWSQNLLARSWWFKVHLWPRGLKILPVHIYEHDCEILDLRYRNKLGLVKVSYHQWLRVFGPTFCSL